MDRLTDSTARGRTTDAPTLGTTIRQPSRRDGGDRPPTGFSVAPTAITVCDGGWQITHRGVTIGRLQAMHGDRLPFRALETACERVIDLELERSDERARDTAAAIGHHGERAQRLIEQRRRINNRVLARRALNELVTLADSARAGDDAAVDRAAAQDDRRGAAPPPDDHGDGVQDARAARPRRDPRRPHQPR